MGNLAPFSSNPAVINLNRIVNIARQSDTVLYLVGGSVRDQIIGLPLKELDLVTLVKPDLFIAELKAKLNAKILSQSPYSTYKLSIGETLVDVCMSRTESYPKAAGKPKIRPASIIMDMHRRDFSANAIALPLFPSKSTRLIDPTNGLADINSGSIRVLHHTSFIDDPTRIIRAIRYEQRLGFTIEQATFKLLLQDKKYLLLLPATKIRKILEEISTEVKIEQIFNRILNLDLLPALNDFLLCLNKHHSSIHSIISVKPNVKYFEIFLGISAWFLPKTQIVKLQKQLALTKQQLKLVDQVLIIKKLSSEISKNNTCLSNIYFKCNQTSELSRMIAIHASSNSYFIKLLGEYETKLKWIRPTLSNADICAKTGITEGPLLGQVIRAIIAAKIDGTVYGKKQEAQLAANIVRASCNIH